jgi:hypothetical protein
VASMAARRAGGEDEYGPCGEDEDGRRLRTGVVVDGSNFSQPAGAAVLFLPRGGWWWWWAQARPRARAGGACGGSGLSPGAHGERVDGGKTSGAGLSLPLTRKVNRIAHLHKTTTAQESTVILLLLKKRGRLLSWKFRWLQVHKNRQQCCFQRPVNHDALFSSTHRQSNL